MTFRRVVLGIGPSSGEPALRAAADLARSMELTLLGLFVEEVALLHLAGLPFATEVSVPSALTRRVDPASMELSLRASSRQAREALARHLAGIPVQWDFTVVRGATLSAVLEMCTEDDLIVASLAVGSVADRRHRREAALRDLPEVRRSLLLVDQVGPRAPLVAVIAPDASLEAVAAELGAVAMHYGGRLTVLVVRGKAPFPNQPDEKAVSTLARLGVATRVRPVADAALLLEQIVAERPGLLVLCGSEGFPETARARLGQLACSMLLLPGRLR